MSEKKSHGVQLLIRTVVKDPDGKVIHDSGQKPSKSFVIQFLEFIYAASRGSALSATDVAGAESMIYNNAYEPAISFSIDAPINVSLYGIVVGTGDTGETNTDYKLETQLTEGVGAGNITHGVVDFVTVAIVGVNVDFEIKRAFTNNTGSLITVAEAGMYTKQTGPPGPKYHCIIRDVLVASVDVPDKCSLTVYYTLRTTV